MDRPLAIHNRLRASKGVCALAIAAAACCLPPAAAESCPAGDLLQLDGVRIPDGYARVVGELAPEGSEPASGALRLDAPLLIDLGAVRTVRAVMVQAGHDDLYTVEGSADGVSWSTLAVARVHGESGLRARAMRLSRPASVRRLRVTASGGDGEWHLAVLSAWCAGWSIPVACSQHPRAHVNARSRSRTCGLRHHLGERTRSHPGRTR